MRHHRDLQAPNARPGAGRLRHLTPILITVLLLGLVVAAPDLARAFVVGKAPAALSSYQIFGNARATGATLMLPGPAGAEVRSVLLSSAAASLLGLPGDATLEKAYIFWSGSLAQNGVTGPKTADSTVTFTTATGAAYTVSAAAGDCTTVVHPIHGTNFPPFFYCRADVTGLVAPNKVAGTYNGTYVVGGVSADPGHVDLGGNCTEPPSFPYCQAKYAAWSMVVVWSSPSETLQRDIHLYDGFLILDHQNGPGGSPGVTSFSIGNFLADQSPQGTLSYFSVETDVQLGQPPQDLYPPSNPYYCTTCQDYVRFNGSTLIDERGWPGNIFNESLGVGSGVDIDAIEIGSLLSPGSTSAVIEVGSGTGPVLATDLAHGGGELIGFGWTLLTLRRPAPNFKTSATNKTVNPTQAGQGETLAYTLNLLNAGSATANGTVITDTLPAQVDYKPGSLQVGGAPCTDAADADACTVSGKTITINIGTLGYLAPQNSRQVSFLAAVAPTATNGQVVCNQFQVVSNQTPTPHSPPPACFTVKAPELLTPQKTVVDLNGGAIGPDDVLQFTVTIPAKNGGPVSGISLLDDMPKNLQLLTVIAPPGAVDSSSPSGGANGKGQVKLSDISIPAGLSSVSVTILAQLDSEAEFVAAGIPADQIDGRGVCNQGSVSAAFLPAPLLTDSPSLPGAGDPTCVTLVYAPKLGTSSKTVLDVNGGKLEPGDVLRYTLTFVNSGNRPATLTVVDDLPPHVQGFALVGSVPGATFAPPPAGANGSGRLTIAGLSVPAGATRTVVFEVTLADDAVNGAAVQNCASFEVAEKPTEGKTLCSPSLTIYAAPDLSATLKTVQDLGGAPARPGDTLRYSIALTNSGNRAATGLSVTDVLSPLLTAVTPLDGGSWNAATRTITWALGSLAKGATATVRFEAKIVVPTANGTSLCNQASVSSAELPVEPSDDPATAAANDATCLSVVSAPDFGASTKTVLDLNGAPTRPGDTLRYTIVVANEGTETGTSVSVLDLVSTSLTAVVALDGGSWNPATRTVSWLIPSLAPGEQKTLRFEATVVTPLPNGTVIDNQALISSAQVPPPGAPTDDPATPAPDDPTRVTVTAEAKLAAEKTVQDVNGGAAQPGDALVYTIRLRNTGDAPARATAVTDVVSTSLTGVVPLDGGAFNVTTRTITWPAADVVPGVDRLLRFQAQVVLPLPNGIVVCNQATASSTDLPAPVLTDNPGTPAPADATCLTVESKPDLSNSVKTVEDLNGGKVEPGDTLRYSIKIENSGTQDATLVTVTDVVSTNLTSVVPLDGGLWNQATRTLSWSLPTVGAKQSVTVRFTAEVVLPLDDGVPIANQASIAAAGLPPVLSDDPATPASDDPTVVTVSSAPSFVTSTKTLTDLSGGKIEPGDTLAYALSLVNSGKSVADQVVVTDVVDPSLELLSVGEGGSYNAATRTITWNGATTPALVKVGVNAAPIALTLQLKVKDPLPNGTQVCNQALIGSQELPLPHKTDNPATPLVGDPTCGTVSSAPDLAGTSKIIVDLNGAPVRPGDTLSYTISIPNTGNAPAVNVSVTDVVDPSLTNVVPAQGGVFDPLTRTITWSAAGTPGLASLAPKATVTLSFTAQVVKPLDNGTAISNQASVLSVDLPAPVLSDDPATPAADDPTVVKVVSAVELGSSTKTVLDGNGGDVEPGDTLTWTITLRNTGDAAAKNVTVTDVVDLALTNVVPLDGGSYNAALRTITWQVPVVGLTPGGDVSLRFTAKVVFPLKNGTKISNQGKLQLETTTVLTDDPKTPEPSDPTVVTVVARPDLSGTEKTVAGAAPGKKVGPGTSLTYSIVIPNTGSEDALDVAVTDIVDTDLDSVVPLDGGSYNPATRTITWTPATIPAGGKVTLRFTAKVKVDAKNGDEVLNQAVVQAPTLRAKVLSDDPSTKEPDDPTRLTIEAVPDLKGFQKTVKDLNGGDAVPGDALEYTLVIRNTGTAYAFNLSVTDPVPPQLENVVAGQGGKVAGGVIVWSAPATPSLAKLAPGAEATLTFTASIRVPQANGTLISNQASLSAEGTAKEPSDDPGTPQLNDPTTIKVVSAPKLDASVKLVQDLNGAPLRPGETIEFELRIRNSGSADASGTTLIDTVPTHTTYVAGSTRLNGNPVADAGTGSPSAVGFLVNSPGAPIGVVRPGEASQAVVRFRVQVRPEVQEGTVISNQGLLKSTSAPLAVTDDPRTPGVVGDPTQIVVGSGPSLSATTKTFDPKPIGDGGNGRFDVGEVIAYKVIIPNTGSARATNVVFTDPLDPAGTAVFLPGGLTLEGKPLTDASDGDAGTMSASQLKVVVGSIEPGQSATITYRVRILKGPRVSNQGTVRTTEIGPELTDSDGNDANGDSPTVVVVEGAGDRKLRIDKTVLDVNGGDVRAGDQLLYTITVRDDGTDFESLDVIDQIPAGTSLVPDSLVLPPGARSSVEPAPAGSHGRGRVTVSGLKLAPGESLTLLLRVRLDSSLEAGASVCNVASAASDGGLDLQSPVESGCVLIGSPVGTGGLSGSVFRDLGDDNRRLDPKDQRLPGFQVQAYLTGNPNTTPVASAITDQNGEYRLASVPPGPYTLRVLTSKGAQMGTSGALRVEAGRALEQDLPVDPSGILYEALSGTPVGGAQVFIHYDSSDPAAPGAQVPPALLGVGQQGQTTDASGFYRFDVERGRRYELRVQPLSPSLQFPSVLIPASEGFAVTGPEQEVVPDDQPDPKREGARLTYYLRFKVDGPADAVFNNHIPLDPMTSLIRLEKRADRRRASLGDLVSYTITVENRSRREFLEAGGVGIEDVMPRGLRLLTGSSHSVRRLRAGGACRVGEQAGKDVDGASICLSRPEPTRATPQVLHFGPIPLGAGESLRLVYQVAVGLDTRQGLYKNRAVLRDASFASELSNSAEAVIEVESDPDLDQGVLVGKVFCDGNGDGRQSRGEHGIAGARVYLDNGTYAVTDSAGKYHLRNIDPGLRLLKLDVNTLPVGSRMTTQVSRVVQFTRGLPAKVSFGARCQENWVSLKDVKLKPVAKARPAAPKLAVPGLSLSGDASSLRLSVDGRPLGAPDLDLRLLLAGKQRGQTGEQLLACRRDAKKRLSPSLVLDLRAEGPSLRGWTVTIRRLRPGGEREVVRRFSGSGRPPAQLLWDGTLAGAPVLRAGALYEAQLQAIGFAGEGGTSPRRRFSVDWTRAPPGPSPDEGPRAFLDGTELALDARARFARVLGRTAARPPLVELRRGDGKSIFVALGGATRPLDDDSLEKVQVKGSLTGLTLQINGKTVDASLLGVRLEAAKEGVLPAALADGTLSDSAELRATYPIGLVRRWTMRVSELGGKRQMVLRGVGQPPDPIRWDGTDPKGAGMVQPGGSYQAQLFLEDPQGNLGQSAPVVLRAPESVGFSALKLQAARLFDLKSGALQGPARQKLQATLRLLQRRPSDERYRLTVRVAPPRGWEAERWAGLLKSVEASLKGLFEKAGIAAERCELTVGALPLPSATRPAADAAPGPSPRPPKRQESIYLDAVPRTLVMPPPEPPRVLVDGEALPVKADGSFEGFVKVNLGSALVIDLRDGSGRRAVLLQPTRPRARLPQPLPSSVRSLPAPRVAGLAPGDGARPGELSLRMREGGTVVLRVAETGPASVPASGPSTRSAGAPPAAAPRGSFGEVELQRAFRGKTPPRPAPRAASSPVAAAQLRVDLPPRGAVLKAHELAIRGQTHPENRVTINGTAVSLEADGRFTHLVKLPDGKSELLIRTEDRQGNQGKLSWPVEVSDRALFLMAMAEGAIGQLGAELDGETDHTHLERGPVMMHGRAVLYMKGRIQGRRLFKQYFITAHVDTAKQREFEDFFDNVIDPNRYYPVYGDSSLEVRDVNARDKYYLLVEADRSSLLVGNFNAGVKGIELLRYDRVLYGVKVDFDKTFLGGKLRQQAKAFVSRDDARLSRDHNLLRATGGSIYYLRHGEVLVGSERVQLVVRERDTGLLLLTVPKTRDLDYVIDYPGGRILFKAPISSVADAGFGISNPAFTMSTMAGHPVYIEVDYEYERTTEQGSGSWGVQVKDTLFDVLTLGASYVEESRSAEAGASYRLYGGEVTWRHGTSSSVTGEFARSQSYDVQNFISEDGGLSYLAMNHVALLSADQRATDSNAFKVTAAFELSDFVKSVRPERLKAQGYFSRLDRGFFSDGSIMEQGRTKYGGAVEWGIAAGHRLTLRHDGAVALLPQIPLPGQPLDPLALREIQTELSRLRYDLQIGRLALQAEYGHQFLRDPLTDGVDQNRDTVGAMASYRFGKRLRVSLGQDAILYHSGTDPQLGTGALGLSVAATDDWRDRLQTTVGVALGITRDLELELAESVRWSGDNATSAGLKMRISEKASVYLRQQLGSVDDRFTTTSVVGAEDRFGKGGRTYGEYQIESGVLGLQNRAILGVTHKWTPWRGIAFAGGYEHQQIFGGHLPDGTPTGDSQRDVVNVGFEVTRFRKLKLSTQAELRYDNGSGVLGLSPTATGSSVLSPNVDTRAGLGQGYYADRLVTPGSQLLLSPGERWQVMTRGGASWAVSRDVTLLGRVNFLRTWNMTSDRVESDALELGFGAALRPVEWDWLNVLFKYSRVLEMRPLSLTDNLARRRTYDIVSLSPIVELPWHLQIVEKIAYKHVQEDLDLLPASTMHQVIHTLLWINRINFHLTGRIDAGVEYRFLRIWLEGQGGQLKHGALVEAGYWIHQFVRLGAGYNFSSFTDNEFADQDRDASGFFFRVVGKY